MGNGTGFEASVVVRTIHSFVRAPKFAVITACNDYSDVDTWILSQAAQSGGMGALAALGPMYAVARNVRAPWLTIVSIALTFADFSVLVNKMAYIGQGIAGLRKCPIDKEQSEVDLAMILGLWTEAITEKDLDGMFEAEARTGRMAVPDQRKIPPKNEFLECPLQTTSEIILIDKGGKKMLTVLGNVFLKRLTRSLLLRLAPRGLAKLAVDFVPFIGAGASAGINYQIVSAIGHCADMYYTKKRAFLDRSEGDKASV